GEDPVPEPVRGNLEEVLEERDPPAREDREQERRAREAEVAVPRDGHEEVREREKPRSGETILHPIDDTDPRGRFTRRVARGWSPRSRATRRSRTRQRGRRRRLPRRPQRCAA